MRWLRRGGMPTADMPHTSASSSASSVVLRSPAPESQLLPLPNSGSTTSTAHRTPSRRTAIVITFILCAAMLLYVNRYWHEHHLRGRGGGRFHHGLPGTHFSRLDGLRDWPMTNRAGGGAEGSSRQRVTVAVVIDLFTYYQPAARRAYDAARSSSPLGSTNAGANAGGGGGVRDESDRWGRLYPLPAWQDQGVALPPGEFDHHHLGHMLEHAASATNRRVGRIIDAWAKGRARSPPALDVASRLTPLRRDHGTGREECLGECTAADTAVATAPPQLLDVMLQEDSTALLPWPRGDAAVGAAEEGGKRAQRDERAAAKEGGGPSRQQSTTMRWSSRDVLWTVLNGLPPSVTNRRPRDAAANSSSVTSGRMRDHGRSSSVARVAPPRSGAPDPVVFRQLDFLCRLPSLLVPPRRRGLLSANTSSRKRWGSGDRSDILSEGRLLPRTRSSTTTAEADAAAKTAEEINEFTEPSQGEASYEAETELAAAEALVGIPFVYLTARTGPPCKLLHRDLRNYFRRLPSGGRIGGSATTRLTGPNRTVADVSRPPPLSRCCYAGDSSRREQIWGDREPRSSTCRTTVQLICQTTAKPPLSAEVSAAWLHERIAPADPSLPRRADGAGRGDSTAAESAGGAFDRFEVAMDSGMAAASLPRDVSTRSLIPTTTTTHVLFLSPLHVPLAPSAPLFIGGLIRDMVEADAQAATCASSIAHGSDRAGARVLIDRGYENLDGEHRHVPSTFFTRRYAQLPISDRRAASIDVVPALNGQCMLVAAHDAREALPKMRWSAAAVHEQCRRGLTNTLRLLHALVELPAFRTWYTEGAGAASSAARGGTTASPPPLTTPAMKHQTRRDWIYEAAEDARRQLWLVAPPLHRLRRPASQAPSPQRDDAEFQSCLAIDERAVGDDDDGGADSIDAGVAENSGESSLTDDDHWAWITADDDAAQGGGHRRAATASIADRLYRQPLHRMPWPPRDDGRRGGRRPASTPQHQQKPRRFTWQRYLRSVNGPLSWLQSKWSAAVDANQIAASSRIVGAGDKLLRWLGRHDWKSPPGLDFWKSFPLSTLQLDGGFSSRGGGGLSALLQDNGPSPLGTAAARVTTPLPEAVVTLVSVLHALNATDLDDEAPTSRPLLAEVLRGGSDEDHPWREDDLISKNIAAIALNVSTPPKRESRDLWPPPPVGAKTDDNLPVGLAAEQLLQWLRTLLLAPVPPATPPLAHPPDGAASSSPPLHPADELSRTAVQRALRALFGTRVDALSARVPQPFIDDAIEGLATALSMAHRHCTLVTHHRADDLTLFGWELSLYLRKSRGRRLVASAELVDVDVTDAYIHEMREVVGRLATRRLLSERGGHPQQPLAAPSLDHEEDGQRRGVAPRGDPCHGPISETAAAAGNEGPVAEDSSTSSPPHAMRRWLNLALVTSFQDYLRAVHRFTHPRAAPAGYAIDENRMYGGYNVLPEGFWATPRQLKRFVLSEDLYGDMPAAMVAGSDVAPLTAAPTGSATAPMLVIWDGHCCRCCGFASEIMGFIAPLSRRLSVRSTMGEDCYCGGYYAFERFSLQRLATSDAALLSLPSAKSDVQVVWVSHRPADAYVQNTLRLRTPNYFIGRSMYEFTRLPLGWSPAFAMINEVWVPGGWVGEVFEAHGLPRSQLFEVPEAVNVFEYDPETARPLRLPDDILSLRHYCTRRPAASASASEHYDDVAAAAANTSGSSNARRRSAGEVGKRPPYTFLSHFKWEPRKGWPFLLDAFFNAFTLRNKNQSPLHQHPGDGSGDTTFPTESSANAATRKSGLLQGRRHVDDGNTTTAAPSGHPPLPSPRGAETAKMGGPTAFEDAEDAGDVAVLYILTSFFYPAPSDPSNASFARDMILTHFAARGITEAELLSASSPPICVVTSNMAEQSMVGLYMASDAFVLPTRGEGWGLPIIQAMALGKPTLATAFSGQTAFMTPDTAFLIQLDAVEEPSAYDSVPYQYAEGKKWATPSTKHLAELMTLVVTEPAYAAEVGRRAKLDIHARFNELAVTNTVEARLRAVHHWLVTRP